LGFARTFGKRLPNPSALALGFIHPFIKIYVSFAASQSPLTTISAESDLLLRRYFLFIRRPWGISLFSPFLIDSHPPPFFPEHLRKARATIYSSSFSVSPNSLRSCFFANTLQSFLSLLEFHFGAVSRSFRNFALCVSPQNKLSEPTTLGTQAVSFSPRACSHGSVLKSWGTFVRARAFSQKEHVEFAFSPPIPFDFFLCSRCCCACTPNFVNLASPAEPFFAGKSFSHLILP